MKYTYYTTPEKMKGLESFGFSWLEFVTSVPSPMFLMTTYKADGKTNACMQSWTSLTTAGGGHRFFALVSSVHKGGHLYATLRERGCAVINLLTAELYDRAMATIRNNAADADELAESGLTAVPAEKVDAPMVDESFMNMECRYVWEKEIVPGDDHVLVCLEIVNVHINAEHLGSRVGEKGLLYNIHHPIDPENFPGKAHDYAGIVQPLFDMGEY